MKPVAGVRAEVKLGWVRGSFLDIFEAKAVRSEPDGKKRFGMTALLDPAKPKHAKHIAEIKAAIAEVKKNGFPKLKPDTIVCQFFNKGEDCTNQETGEVYSGYEGMYAVRANSPEDRPPFVFGGDGSEASKGDHEFYSGAFYHVKLTIYPTDGGGKNQVCCGLESVKFAKHGEPLAGRARSTAAEFGDFDADDEDEEGDGTGL